MGVRGKKNRTYTIAQKLEIVQVRQSGLSLHEVSQMFGADKTTISNWQKAYEARGIAGLEPAPRGGAAQRLKKTTEAAEEIVQELAAREPESGISKVQGQLYRHGFLDLARETVRRILRRQGHPPQEQRVRRKQKHYKPRFFERANPNDLWQTDIMTFMLKGMYRVYVIGFIDDHSRMIVGWGLYRFQTAANVMEVFRAAIEKHGMPKEVLSDNGRQYYTWRGKSAFTQMLTKLGIRHIRSRPYHPQTLGKIESFWRNLLQECLTRTPVSSFEEMQAKVGEYIEYYNFKRPHQGIQNLTPSDRFYLVAEQVKQIIERNTAKVEEAGIAVEGYTPPAYIVGNIDGKELRIVAKDAEVSLREAPSENLESKEPAGPNGERHVQSPRPETEQPAGEAGAGLAGTEPDGLSGGALPAGGGVQEPAVPVVGDVQGSDAEGIGAQEGWPQAGGGQAEPRAGEGTAGAPEGAAEGAGAAASGEGAPGEGRGGGAADHPAQRLERGAEGGPAV